MILTDKNLTKEEARLMFWHDKKTGDLHRVAMTSTNGKPPLKNGKELKKWLKSKHSRDTNGSYPFAIRAKKDSHGRKYHISVLKVDGKRKQTLVHRLIWNYYHGRIDDNMVIDHVNNNSLDNRIENLQCITQSENIRRIPSSVKTEANRKRFLTGYGQSYKSGIKGLYTDGVKKYIRLPSGKKRYLNGDNYEEIMDYLGVAI